MKYVRNVPASVRQRLLSWARSGHRPFNELLHYFAIERFPYRLYRSEHAERLILKGALIWAGMLTIELSESPLANSYWGMRITAAARPPAQRINTISAKSRSRWTQNPSCFGCSQMPCSGPTSGISSTLP